MILEKSRIRAEIFSDNRLNRLNPGTWVRENALLLSRQTHTGVDYWVSLTIRDLRGWIRSLNGLIEKRKHNSRTTNNISALETQGGF